MSKSIDANTVDAKDQLKKEQMVFYIGSPDAKIKIAIVGNSITRHGIKESIGWTKLCGMAASDEAHDYVHILYSLLKKDGYDVCFMVNQLSYWEVNYKNDITLHYDDIRAFGADYFVFRLGENVERENVGEFKRYMEELIDFVINDKTRVIMTTCFWKYEDVDNAIKTVAEKRSYPLVDLGDLGERDDMKAIGMFEHTGVAAHPGDKGMAEIAKGIYKEIVNDIKEHKKASC